MYDITSQVNIAMFGRETAWNVFDADGKNAMGYSRQSYIDAGVLADDDMPPADWNRCDTA
jgi:hypothetical protein